MWGFLAGEKIIRVDLESRNSPYQTIIKKCKKDQLIQIKKDLNRTPLPDFPSERTKQEFLMRLQHIMVAYSRANTDVGYVQGMNVIIAHMLYSLCQGDFDNMKEIAEQCFYIFCALLENFKVKELFSEGMPAIVSLVHTFQNYLQYFDKDFYLALNDKNDKNKFDYLLTIGSLLLSLGLSACNYDTSSRIIEFILLYNINGLIQLYCFFLL